MSDVSTSHVALILTVFGIGMPTLTAIALFLLQRLFGSGDKAGAEIDELKDKVHALELAAERAHNHTREHVAAQFATKTDIAELKETVRGFAQAQQQYHEALLALLTPIANQLIGISPVRKS
jgi:hypothetical protein